MIAKNELWSGGFVFHNSQLQKSPSRIFGQNSRNSVDISKSFSEMVIWKFESSQVSQPVRRLEAQTLVIVEMPANGWLLRTGYRSPGSEFGPLRDANAESLRQHAGIFPFLGDRDQRPFRSTLRRGDGMVRTGCPHAVLSNRISATALIAPISLPLCATCGSAPRRRSYRSRHPAWSHADSAPWEPPQRDVIR